MTLGRGLWGGWVRDTPLHPELQQEQGVNTLRAEFPSKGKNSFSAFVSNTQNG